MRGVHLALHQQPALHVPREQQVLLALLVKLGCFEQLNKTLPRVLLARLVFIKALLGNRIAFLAKEEKPIRKWGASLAHDVKQISLPQPQDLKFVRVAPLVLSLTLDQSSVTSTTPQVDVQLVERQLTTNRWPCSCPLVLCFVCMRLPLALPLL